MKRFAVYAGVAVALFLALTVAEIFSSGDPFSPFEFGFDLFETALLALAVVFTSYSTQEIREARSDRRDLVARLSLARADGERWRAAAAMHANGLGSAIQQQFTKWRLTASECDVAMLMLKGFSHKEIAQLRNSSAATVRQQAAAIYGKSGLASRAELAAYFLEDLFPAPDDRGNGPGALPPPLAESRP